MNPVVPTLVVTVPRPPSANHMFQRAMTKRGKRNLTPEYQEWRDRAGWLLRMQLVGREPIACRFDVRIEVPISRRDTDNWIKPLLDICQRVGAITNDGNQNSVQTDPVERDDCMLAFFERRDLGGIRSAIKPGYSSRRMPAKPKRARLDAVNAVRARVLF